MLLDKQCCFANESEARSSFSDLLARLSTEDSQLFDRALSAIFSVRQKLVDLVHRSGAGKTRAAVAGLPDICITASEDYVLPALSAQGIGCYMEIRQYSFDEIAAGLPRIHAYVTIPLDDFELIIDVDADPFYCEDVGVVISPDRAGLYSWGSPVHRRWVTESGRIEKFECYTRESRVYLTGEGVSYLTLRNYFFESDANQCPVVLSPFVAAYFSYSAGWIGMERRDWIKLILVAHSQEQKLLLWNLTFDDLSSIEIRFTEMKSLHLVFLDNTDIHIPLDGYGYPLESDTVRYGKCSAKTQSVVKYAFRSSPTDKILLPSPFDRSEIWTSRETRKKTVGKEIKASMAPTRAQN